MSLSDDLVAPYRAFITSTKKPDARAVCVHIGFQEGFKATKERQEDVAGFHLFNLTVQVGNHPTGSTVSAATLANLGYDISHLPKTPEPIAVIRAREHAATTNPYLAAYYDRPNGYSGD